jgi:hypothetical protein
MTAVAARPAPAPVAEGPPRHASALRWALHLLGIVALLGVGVLVVDNGAVLSADEGAVLIQARVLQETGGWVLASDPVLDPEGAWFPVIGGATVEGGRMPFVKPPWYPRLIAILLGAGGLGLVLFVHAVALAAAAWCVGRTVEILRPGWGIPTMWATAFGTPLLFDGFWVIAHSISVAGAALALLGATRFACDRWRWGAGVMVVGIVVSAGFRIDGVLAGLALAPAIVVATWSRSRLAGLAGAALATTASLATYVGVSAAAASVTGAEGTTLVRPSQSGSFVAGRLHAAGQTLLKGALFDATSAAVASLAAVGLIAAAIAIRRGVSGKPITGLAGVSMVAAGWWIVRPADMIPGLLIAAPGVIVGWALLRSDALRLPAVRLAAVASLGTVLAVLASQSSDGGVGEWGGRYFHVALPAAIVVAAAGLSSADRIRPPRALIVATVVVSTLWSVGAMRAHVVFRDTPRQVADAVADLSRDARSVRQPGGPVVIMTWPPQGRFLWDQVTGGRYLTVHDEGEVPRLVQRLRTAGVVEVVVVADPSGRPLADALTRTLEVSERRTLGERGWQVLRVNVQPE